MSDFSKEEQEWIEANASDPAMEPDILRERLRLMIERAEAAEAKLAKAVEALEKIDVGEGWAAQIARTTLSELTGGKDE